VQIAAGSWILEAMTAAPKRAAARSEKVEPASPPPRAQAWAPPPAQGRGQLIDLIV
jgi:hypothetical protein